MRLSPPGPAPSQDHHSSGTMSSHLVQELSAGNSPNTFTSQTRLGRAPHALADTRDGSWSLCSITSPSRQGNLYRADNKLHRHVAEGVTSQRGLGNTGSEERGEKGLINYLLPQGDWFRQHERLKVSRMQGEAEGKNLLPCMDTDRHHRAHRYGQDQAMRRGYDLAHQARR